ncbi:MAG TPA: hypothetical protein VGS57_11730 [Thermoanaerobaculia bacterium]|nr:hypothetical protein [Thermoanaerobaculia bacterium]
MHRLVRSVLLGAMMVGLLSCEARTDRTDTGGVLLTVSDYELGNITIPVSVNDHLYVQADSITLQNVVLNPSAPTSGLMDVELKSYQVRYRRADTGTRVPRPLTDGIFGNVPQGGNDTINDLTLMGPDQLRNVPLSDLLAINGGFDKETGSPFIKLELELTFFGKTLSGDEVSTNPVRFALDFHS